MPIKLVKVEAHWKLNTHIAFYNHSDSAYQKLSKLDNATQNLEHDKVEHDKVGAFFLRHSVEWASVG